MKMTDMTDINPYSDASDWYRLDNAGKLFPCTKNKFDTKVFRFAPELTEDVDPIILQKALDETMGFFPMFRCVLKKGLFWYYLEECQLNPSVHEEDRTPCAPIYSPSVRNLLFDVSYYKRRINVEFFHTLTDGTGALCFVKLLVCRYVALAHPNEFPNGAPQPDFDMSPDRSGADDFDKYYTGEPVKNKVPGRIRAYRIKGTRNREFRLSIIEGVMKTRAVIDAAHKYGTTVTVFLTSLLIQSIGASMTAVQKRRPIIVSVPVNLRNYFESSSARNFFAMIKIQYKYTSPEEDKLETIIASVKESFSALLERDNLKKVINGFAAIEHNIFIRIIPLPIKTFCIKVYNKYLEGGITASLSNLGSIKLPEGVTEHVRLVDVFFSTEKLQICMSSFGENMTITFTSPFRNAGIQRVFFRSLESLGADAEITSNNE